MIIQMFVSYHYIKAMYKHIHFKLGKGGGGGGGGGNKGRYRLTVVVRCCRGTKGQGPL